MILAPKIKKPMIFGFFSVFGRNLWNSDKIWCIFSKNRRENCKISVILLEIHENVTKICDENLLNCWGRRGAKEYKSCRSRQELSNEYLLAKIGFDTAEHEPCKVCPIAPAVRPAPGRSQDRMRSHAQACPRRAGTADWSNRIATRCRPPQREPADGMHREKVYRWVVEI